MTLAPRESGHSALGSGDLDDLAGEQPPDPGEDLDLALLQQAREAFEELVYDSVLPVLADGELDRGLAGLDPELLRPFDGAEHGGRLEELLRRHAAPVQAGPADLVLLDDRDRQPGRPGVESRGVPARPTTDDDDVVLRRLGFVPWQTNHLPFQPKGCRMPIGRATCRHRSASQSQRISSTSSRTLSTSNAASSGLPAVDSTSSGASGGS